jgi:hypothetical protein
MWPFEYLVWAHIVTGATGAVAFWVPVIGRKGSRDHRRYGQVFVNCMLITGTLAVAMSICTLIDPQAHHTTIPDVALVRGIFGWMMLYLGILTISLAWHGRIVVRNKANHRANRTPLHVGLQVAVIVAALNCAVHGLLIGQVLMIGISLVGIASGLTNLYFIYNPAPARTDYLMEHVKALVGAGISVYTAFMAFGSVRIMPELALNPVMWSIPLTTGIALIVYHQRVTIARGRNSSPVTRQRPQPAPPEAAPGT